jgi:hypothetical protein
MCEDGFNRTIVAMCEDGFNRTIVAMREDGFNRPGLGSPQSNLFSSFSLFCLSLCSLCLCGEFVRFQPFLNVDAKDRLPTCNASHKQGKRCGRVPIRAGVVRIHMPSQPVAPEHPA